MRGEPSEGCEALGLLVPKPLLARVQLSRELVRLGLQLDILCSEARALELYVRIVGEQLLLLTRQAPRALRELLLQFSIRSLGIPPHYANATKHCAVSCADEWHRQSAQLTEAVKEIERRACNC